MTRILVGYRPELLAGPLGLRPVGEERVVLVDPDQLPGLRFPAHRAVQAGRRWSRRPGG